MTSFSPVITYNFPKFDVNAYYIVIKFFAYSAHH